MHAVASGDILVLVTEQVACVTGWGIVASPVQVREYD